MKQLAILVFLFSAVQGWSAGQVQWIHSFDQAVIQAKKSGKPIFIDAFADWCDWCHKLDQEVYADAKFVKYIERFVPVKIDVEDGGEGTQFAEKYAITGLPTLLVTDANGILTNRIGGFMEVDQLIEDLEGIQKLVERERKNSKDADASFQLAKEYLARDMNTEAESRFQRILSSPDATTGQRETSQFSLALTQYYQRNFDLALGTLESYEKTYQYGESGEDALLLLSEIHMELDANDKARYYLEQFLKKYPNSGNKSRALQVLSTLDEKSN